MNDTGEHQIERPFVEEFDDFGEKKHSEDSDLRYLVEPFDHMNHRDDVKDVKEIYKSTANIVESTTLQCSNYNQLVVVQLAG